MQFLGKIDTLALCHTW